MLLVHHQIPNLRELFQRVIAAVQFTAISPFYKEMLARIPGNDVEVSHNTPDQYNTQSH